MFWLSSDPQVLLSFLDEIDSDESDGEFNGFVDSDDEEYQDGEKEREERQTMEWHREETGNHSNSETQGIVCDGKNSQFI